MNIIILEQHTNLYLCRRIPKVADVQKSEPCKAVTAAENKALHRKIYAILSFLLQHARPIKVAMTDKTHVKVAIIAENLTL